MGMLIDASKESRQMFARQKRYDVDGLKIAIGVNDYFQQSLPTPEVRGSNAVICKIVFCQLYRKYKKKERTGRE